MAVRKKGRRKLAVSGRQFVWWVGLCDPEGISCEALTVVSEDGQFFIRYHLRQKPERRYLVVRGREFAGLPDAGGCWIRVQCPDWGSDGAIRPSDVRRIVEWSLSRDMPRVRMNYLGDVVMLQDIERLSNASE